MVGAGCAAGLLTVAAALCVPALRYDTGRAGRPLPLAAFALLLLHSHGRADYDFGDFRMAMAVQYVFWGFGIFQILRYRRKGLDHLRRMHPGAVEKMRRGEPFVHPGFSDREGV